MDTSDFYDTAILALHALTTGEDKQEAINELRSFIRAADAERMINNSVAAYRCHVRES